ncbi:MAG: leucyl aminopeptidase family protein [Bacteroidales bacterium]
MSPVIDKVSRLNDDQSVVAVCGNESSIAELKLTDTETVYARRCLADRDELIVVNSYSRVVIIMMEKSGSEPSVNREETRRLAVKVLDHLKFHRIRTIAITSLGAAPESLVALAEGLIMGSYRFTRHKTVSRKEKVNYFPEKILIRGIEDFTYIESFREAIYFTRDLVNEPLSHLTAEMMAERIREFTTGAGARVEVFGIRKIESLKMGGLLAVNRGSLDPPSFTVIEWKPEKSINKNPVVLVGKGVVFDSGGLNLKPTDYIEDMKADMAGAAAVAAVMYMAAKLGLPLNLMAFIPATDNRPGVRAYAPGDVIKMYNGKSVEVLNTDAEGRLILADALSYADNFDPALVITLATLTGSAANTFGNQAIAMMGNADHELFDLLTGSGDLSYERVAALPFWNEYGELLKSDIADLKNIGGKEAGAITAGKFLENFTQAPFIHLDIAGTAILKKDDHYRLKGGTGAGVRVLTEFLTRLAAGECKL